VFFGRRSDRRSIAEIQGDGRRCKSLILNTVSFLDGKIYVFLSGFSSSVVNLTLKDVHIMLSTSAVEKPLIPEKE